MQKLSFGTKGRRAAWILGMRLGPVKRRTQPQEMPIKIINCSSLRPLRPFFAIFPIKRFPKLSLRQKRYHEANL
jgi:hypothetical protein